MAGPGVVGLSDLNNDLYAIIADALGADGRPHSSTSVRARRAWVAAELRRLQASQPAALMAGLPLHQRQAFLQPIPTGLEWFKRHEALRWRLPPGVHVRTAARTANFEVVLASDGSAWTMNGAPGAQQCGWLPVPEPEPGRRAVVRSLACWDHGVAVVRDDGVLLLAGDPESGEADDLPKDPEQLAFGLVALGGERAMQVCAGMRWIFALTEPGSI